MLIIQLESDEVGRSMDILLVDDDQDIIEQSKIFFEKLEDSFNVDISRSAEKGLARLKKFDYDAVISDYKMSPKSGLDFLEEVRDSGIDIPFIIFTGKGKEEVAMKALNLGADRYIMKGGEPRKRYELLIDAIKQEVDHYRTKEKLEARKKQFERSIELAPHPVMLHAENGEVLSVNKMWSDITGFQEEDIPTLGEWMDKSLDGGEERFEEGLEKLFDQKKKKTEGIYTINSKDDEERIWELSSSRIRKLLDGRWMILSMANDITDQKKAEDKLKNFKEAVEASMDAVGISTPAGEPVYLNETFREIFGEAIEDPPKELYVNEEIGQEIFEELKRGEEWTGEVKMYDKNGEVLDIHLRAYPVCEDGEIVSLVGVHTDITERKETERELRKSQKRYRSIVEDSPYGIVVYNRKEGLQYINSAGAETLGMKNLEEHIGDSIIEVVHPDYRNIITDKVEDSTEEGEWTELHEEKFIRMDNDEVIDVEVSGSSIEFENESSIMTIFRDITERKKAKEKLEKSLKEKKVLLSEIHHRVKNNLQMISSMLRLQAKQEEEEEVSQALREGKKRIMSMAVIHEMLYREENMAFIELSHYIERLVKTLYRTYNIGGEEIKFERDMEDIELNIEQAIPCGLIINEIVSNVLLHAFPEDHRGPKKLKISSSLREQKKVNITIKDTGTGIESEVDLNDTETFGLHLVKILVEDQLEGDLKIDKENGTSFTIEFKKRDQDE